MRRRVWFFLAAAAHAALHGESAIPDWFYLVRRRGAVFGWITMINGGFYAIKSSIFYWFFDRFVDVSWSGFLGWLVQTAVDLLKQINYLDQLLAWFLPHGLESSYLADELIREIAAFLAQFNYLGMFLAGLLPGGCKPSYLVLLASSFPAFSIICYLAGNTAKLGFLVLISPTLWRLVKSRIDAFVDWWSVVYPKSTRRAKSVINKITGK